MVSQVSAPSTFKQDNSIDEKQELVVVRSSTERFFFQRFIFIIPAIYILRAILEYIDLREFPLALLDLVRIPTEIVLIIALILSNILFAAIPDTISQLFSSTAITQKTSNAERKSTSQNSFIGSFDSWLNHQYRKFVGMLVSLLTLTYYIIRIGGPNELIAQAGITLSFVDLLFYILPAIAYAYFVGIIVWKLAVTSLSIQSIPEHFNVKVKFGHPDSAGGLLPIGVLCLRMAYVTIAPTLLSVLIILAFFVGRAMNFPYIIANLILLLGFAPLILLAGIIGTIIALMPMLKFHQVMLQHKSEMQSLLNQVSAEIVELKTNLVAESENAEHESIEDTVQRISALETFYEAHQSINTWPMNRHVLVRIWATITFLAAQVIAIWNLISRFR